METLEQYVQIMGQVARVSKSHFLDLWSLMRSQPNYAKFLKSKDGVHFNQQGYEFFAPILTLLTSPTKSALRTKAMNLLFERIFAFPIYFVEDFFEIGFDLNITHCYT